MRFDTLNAASYLVWRLQNTGIVRDIRDDGDLISIELQSREKLLIYLIERQMTLSDVDYHLKTNSRKGLHTLFLFWIDMLLPRDGSLYFPDDWMQVVMSLHGDKIYGFEVAGREAYFVPVYFEGTGYQRRTRYGGVVDYARLNCYTISTKSSHLQGTWRVASFETNTQHAHTSSPHHHPISQRDPGVIPHFKTLGIRATDDIATVKNAYRKLARQYHPDLNQNESAIRKMKHINNAYTYIMRVLENS